MRSGWPLSLILKPFLNSARVVGSNSNAPKRSFEEESTIVPAPSTHGNR
jgi:hypothetical protein